MRMKKILFSLTLVFLISITALAAAEGFVLKPDSGTDFIFSASLNNGLQDLNFGNSLNMSFNLNKMASVMILANTPDGKTVLLSPNGFNAQMLFHSGEQSVYLGTAGVEPFHQEGTYAIQILVTTYPLSFFDDVSESFSKARQTYYTFKEHARQMLIQSRMESSQEWIAQTFSLTLSQAKGHLDLHSVPEGATVYLDGQQMGVTPLLTSLKPGIHELLLKKDHFKDLKTNIMITANQTSGKTFELQPGWGNGEIMVDSFPQGAMIQVDGLDAGKTPNRVKMSYGTHVVSIFKDGYEFFSKIVVIDGDQGISRDIDESLTAINTLSNPMATLSVQIAQSGSEWKLDGVVQKNTSVQLNPGYHVIEVTKQGYESDLQRIYIPPSQSKTIQINLLALKGSVLVEVENTYASVFVNGELMGTSPCAIPLAEGNYQITLIAPGYRTELRDVRIQSGRQTEIRLKMNLAPNNF